MAEGRKLIQDEDQNPLTENIVENDDSEAAINKRINRLSALLKLVKRKRKDNEK